MKKCIFAFFLLISHNLYAADEPVKFDVPEKYDRYYNLIKGIRCLVCQNQSLADSHAELAQDLRNEIIIMINKGKTDDDVLKFLVDHYGDFVLYQPPFKKNTWLLWLGPFIFLVIAIIVTFIIIRKQTKNKSNNLELTTEQQLFELTQKGKK